MSRRSVSEERRAAEERAAAHSESLRKHCARLAIQLAEVTQLAEQQVRTKAEEAAGVQQEAGVRVQTLANESAALRQSLAAANEEVGRLRKQNETLTKARQGGAAERGGERGRDSSPRSRSPAPQSGAFGGTSATRAAEERSNGKFDGEKDTIDRQLEAARKTIELKVAAERSNVLSASAPSESATRRGRRLQRCARRWRRRRGGPAVPRTRCRLNRPRWH